MHGNEELLNEVKSRLSTVIDPETGVDVMRMKLVRDLSMDDGKKLSYVFRPSSPLCPIAIPLVLDIIHAVREIQEIKAQRVRVEDYLQADELNEMLRSLLGEE